MNLLNPTFHLRVSEFVQILINEKVCFGAIAFYPDGEHVATHPVLDQFGTAISSYIDFDHHEGLIFQIDKQFKFIYIVAIHRTIRGVVNGNTTTLTYEYIDDILTDCLKTSKADSYSNALSGAWAGGGCSVRCFYGGVAASINHSAKATGNHMQFMDKIHGVFRPRPFTLAREPFSLSELAKMEAMLVYSILSAINFYNTGREGVKGLTANINGLTIVGVELSKILLDKGAYINISDDRDWLCRKIINYGLPGQVTSLEKQSRIFAIYTEPCDFFIPCINGGTLNNRTIKMLNARYVIGPAQDQLCDPFIDSIFLQSKGIIYIPEFFVNRTHCVSIDNEFFQGDQLCKEVLANIVYNETLGVMKRAAQENITPLEAAEVMASVRSQTPRPNSSYRGDLEMNALLDRYWHYSTC
jgi:hypothetical protein